jgi:hypothetical protein
MCRVSSLIVMAAFLLWLAPSRGAHGQTINDEGVWTALFAQGNLTDHGCRIHRLKWWFDGHARFLDDTGGFAQSIVRPGIGLGISENSALWAGYGWIRTSPVSGSDFDEHRIWQQWTWSKGCNQMKFALRSRFEQRLVETGDETGLRFRQFVRAQRSLPRCPRLTLVAWDEIFFNLNDTDWGAVSGFNQNRVFVGFGIKRFPSRKWRTEIGYLNQTVNVPGPTDRSNHILSINVFWNP